YSGACRYTGVCPVYRDAFVPSGFAIAVQAISLLKSPLYRDHDCTVSPLCIQHNCTAARTHSRPLSCVGVICHCTDMGRNGSPYDQKSTQDLKQKIARRNNAYVSSWSDLCR
ncbi:unnamed protein product, partial [Sphacelaria rigidula]